MSDPILHENAFTFDRAIAVKEYRTCLKRLEGRVHNNVEVEKMWTIRQRGGLLETIRLELRSDRERIKKLQNAIA